MTALSNRVEIGFSSAQRDALAAQFKATGESLESAARIAAINTTLWLRGVMVQGLAAATPAVKSFWERRVLAFLTTGTDFLYGRVFIGLYRPSATVKNFPIATMFQRGKGAYIGATYFEGGFIATMPSGTTGIFKRTGGRTSTGKQAIRIERFEDLPGAEELVAEWEERAVARYREEFDKALQGELAKAA